MSNVTITPNMNMPSPVVGVEPGPDWATDVNACLSIVDSHTHTTGQGVPITPAAIDINADLPFNGFNATTFRSVRFSPQGSAINAATDLGCLYEQGVDLYYIDGAGNQVRITQGGSVTGASGTITGLPSGTASASFAGATFTFQSATNTPAAMNFGPVTLGQAVASGKNVTISASGSQASNYNLTLPIALPGSSAFLTVDASGNLSNTLISTIPTTSTVYSTTYSPTLVGVSGGSSFGLEGPCMVTRVNNAVTVSGKTNFIPSANITTWTMTLPIARTAGNFTQQYQAVGSTNNVKAPSTVQSGTVDATVGAETVTCIIASTSGNNEGFVRVQFTYYLTNF